MTVEIYIFGLIFSLGFVQALRDDDWFDIILALLWFATMPYIIGAMLAKKLKGEQ